MIFNNDSSWEVHSLFGRLRPALPADGILWRQVSRLGDSAGVAEGISSSTDFVCFQKWCFVFINEWKLWMKERKFSCRASRGWGKLSLDRIIGRHSVKWLRPQNKLWMQVNQSGQHNDREELRYIHRCWPARGSRFHERRPRRNSRRTGALVTNGSGLAAERSRGVFCVHRRLKPQIQGN